MRSTNKYIAVAVRRTAMDRPKLAGEMRGVAGRS
jgi:hypothetical protein